MLKSLLWWLQRSPRDDTLRTPPGPEGSNGSNGLGRRGVAFVAASLLGVSMTHQVLARKYRPKQFADVVGQPHVVQALTNALNQQYLHHAYLFTGTRGVGKTTTARIIAKCLNCEKGISPTPCGECNACTEIDSGRFPDLYEVDAASRTKVEDTRELLDNAQYSPTKGRYKIYLIDEVHMLSGHSFNALLKTLEEPPEHVKFLLATTDHQKLPATVLSRCLQFHLKQMMPEQIATHLEHILQQENIRQETAALPLLGQAANGSMRDALSLLDQAIAFGNGEISLASVKAMLGTIEPTALYDILNALNERDADTLMTCAAHLNELGVNFSHALADMLAILHQIAVLQATTVNNTNNDALKQLASTLSPEDVQLFYQIALLGQRDLAFAPTPRTGFEMTLLRMLAFYPELGENQAAPAPRKQPAKTTAKAASANSNKTTAAPSKLSNDWNDIVAQLNLTGAARILAQNCNLAAMGDNEVQLVASPKQKPLIQAKQVERINEALNDYLQRKVKIKITVSEQTHNTPADIAKKAEEDRHEAAKQAISNDPKVQKIMKTFDATIVESSITPTHNH